VTGLRADAGRNRQRILEAARKLLATNGLGVSVAAVAREAGVGKATLSRHAQPG
jgi:AcrR family transcriptional regulator